jgi:hypothetical protein
MEKSQIIEKVRKLYAKASEINNPEEAAIAMKAMQNIMLKHNLSERDLFKDEFGNIAFILTGAPWARQIVGAIAYMNMCKTLYKPITSKAKYTIIGKEENALIVKELSEKVIRTAELSSIGCKDRLSFCKGFSFQVCNMIFDIVDASKRDGLDENTTGLVVANIYDSTLNKIDEYVKKSFATKQAKQRSQAPVSAADFELGRLHGSSVNLQNKVK